MVCPSARRFRGATAQWTHACRPVHGGHAGGPAADMHAVIAVAALIAWVALAVHVACAAARVATAERAEGRRRRCAAPFPPETECIACLDRIVEVRFTPCGHACLCHACFSDLVASRDEGLLAALLDGSDCAQPAVPCPLCRKPVLRARSLA